MRAKIAEYKLQLQVWQSVLKNMEASEPTCEIDSTGSLAFIQDFHDAGQSILFKLQMKLCSSQEFVQHGEL